MPFISRVYSVQSFPSDTNVIVVCLPSQCSYAVGGTGSTDRQTDRQQEPWQLMLKCTSTVFIL
jgi:hypothetical protein